MESVLISLAVGIPVLALLIFVHELGHFLVAKACGVGVLEFAVGFGKKIWSHDIGETRYSIRAIPLGGYVRMVGDDWRKFEDEDGKTEFSVEGLDEELVKRERKMLEQPDKLFLKKNFWKRSAIVLAGPFANFLLAWLVSFSGYFFYGASEPVTEAVIGATLDEMPAQSAGLIKGDRVLTIDGSEVFGWKELSERIRKSEGKELLLTVERKTDEGGESKKEIHITPVVEGAEFKVFRDKTDSDVWVIGIVPDFINIPVSVWEGGKLAAFNTVGMSLVTLRSMWMMIEGVISPRKIGGPIAIVDAAGKSASKGLEGIFGFIFVLSVSLAVLNLLPIPVLDGGHFMFFILGALSGREPGGKWYEFANKAGMCLLLSLMLFAVANDIWRLFSEGNGF